MKGKRCATPCLEASVILFLIGGCASPTVFVAQDDGERGRARDVDGSAEDGGGSEAGCQCPVVPDEHASRSCEEGSTDCTVITCQGDHYDVDGRADNGCEARDIPGNNTSSTATEVDIPDAEPIDINSQILSDDRPHDTEPVLRPLGLPDWWKVTAVGPGNAEKTMQACLFIGDLPPDSRFEICISEAGSMTPSVCKTVTPNTPPGPNRCVSAMADAGTFYVRAVKEAGAHSAKTYALYLDH